MFDFIKLRFQISSYKYTNVNQIMQKEKAYLSCKMWVCREDVAYKNRKFTLNLWKNAQNAMFVQ